MFSLINHAVFPLPDICFINEAGTILLTVTYIIIYNIMHLIHIV